MHRIGAAVTLRALVTLLAAMSALVAAPATAQPAGIVVAEAYTYWPGDDDVLGGTAPGTTGPLVIAAGTDLLFVNAETFAPDPHSVTSIGCLDAAEPCWFDSSRPRAQAPGEHAIVRTSHLAPGAYRFFCVAHPEMRGTLQVV